jgi:hypothetical protein
MWQVNSELEAKLEELWVEKCIEKISTPVIYMTSFDFLRRQWKNRYIPRWCWYKIRRRWCLRRFTVLFFWKNRRGQAPYWINILIKVLTIQEQRSQKKGEKWRKGKQEGNKMQQKKSGLQGHHPSFQGLSFLWFICISWVGEKIQRWTFACKAAPRDLGHQTPNCFSLSIYMHQDIRVMISMKKKGTKLSSDELGQKFGA